MDPAGHGHRPLRDDRERDNSSPPFRSLPRPGGAVRESNRSGVGRSRSLLGSRGSLLSEWGSLPPDATNLSPPLPNRVTRPSPFDPKPLQKYTVDSLTEVD